MSADERAELETEHDAIPLLVTGSVPVSIGATFAIGRSS
jgi:hypothetical protein